MNWNAVVCVIITIVGAASSSSCTRSVSNEAPPKSNEPLVLEGRPSTVVIPIVASLADLQATLNQQTPNPLLVVDEELSKCIPAKYATVCPVPKLHIKCNGLKCRNVADGCAVRELTTKITPDISCRLKGNVTRGQISLSGTGQTLSMAAPVNIDIAAKDVGGIIKSETATGSADVRASATLDIDEDWNPKVEVTADYTWRDKIGVDILGQRITFANKVDPKIEDFIAKFRSGIPAQLHTLAIKDKLSEAWEKGFASIQLSENPPAWLRFTPEAVGYSGYQISDGFIRLSLMAEGVTETFLGPKPGEPKPTPLPKLVKNLSAEGFEFYLPVLASYNTLQDAAKKALRVGKQQSFDVPKVGKVQVTFEDVTIYQTSGGAIAVGVKMTADPPNSFFDTKGTLWLSARPEIDNDKHIATVKSFDIATKSDNQAIDLLVSILRVPVINEQLTAAIRYDFSEKYLEGLEKANSALRHELARNLFLEGQIESAAIDRVAATSEGLYLGLIVRGTAAIHYENPAEGG